MAFFEGESARGAYEKIAKPEGNANVVLASDFAFDPKPNGISGFPL
jgi:hypothetical protein